ncbi:capsid protein [Plesiomonas shigelloides]|uniref:GPO family capsid scaffolding protein n=1 Tax=Plesiomonas shigelloides TaxID=703 RepID=UPI001261B844|nr:GPO family capsid scaffolding protein [Plesiomonas shigelloides]KAB7715716.1 capsid protein [Plesiomonas shigelloides]
MSRLKTDWVVIATSGKTIDGRVIEPIWLKDAAKCYSRDEHTAMIWPFHAGASYRAFSLNFGEVDELKIENDGDTVKLLARLIPNQFLIEANRANQKLFTSIEIGEDYLGTGKYFLAGLAVTDTPASIGTTRLQFSQTEKSGLWGNVEPLTFSCVDNDEQAKKGFFARLFSYNTQSDNLSETEMKEEQFKQVMSTITKISERMEDVEKRFSALTDGGNYENNGAPTTAKNNANAANNPSEQHNSNDDAHKTFATQQQVEQLLTGIQSLTTKVDGLNKAFSDLQQDATDLPNANPSGSEVINLV